MAEQNRTFSKTASPDISSADTLDNSSVNQWIWPAFFLQVLVQMNAVYQFLFEIAASQIDQKLIHFAVSNIWLLW